jgi:uncharacterized protein with NRDE domain
MCLVLFAWKVHPEHRLVLAANRDEFHQRPSRELHWWPDQPNLLAGRDLQAGGTWLAVGRTGRFATVTNYREHQRKKPGLRSRGAIVTDFVGGKDRPATFAESIEGERYAGFSLLAADDADLCYVSNRGDDPVTLAPGVYGLSNASLGAPWAKVVRGRDALHSLIDSGNANLTSLVRLMGDRTAAPVHEIETGELPFELARALTATFIVSPDYGTRCTTVMTWSYSGDVSLGEYRFDPAGEKAGESQFRFAAMPAQTD